MASLAIDPQAVDISISTDGQVSGLLPGQTERTVFGNVEVASFVNPAGLLAVGDNIFLQSAVSGEPIVGEPGIEGRGEIRQRGLESSNVELVREMVDMIQTQRAYEINSQVIQTSNEMMQTVGQLRR